MKQENIVYEEKILKGGGGFFMMLLSILLFLSILPTVIAAITAWSEVRVVAVILSVVALLLGTLILCGLQIVKPNEALVMMFFGKYYGTLKEAGFHFVNPFCNAYNPTALTPQDVAFGAMGGQKDKSVTSKAMSKAISMKAMTLDNGKQKINDAMGNPIEIGIVVIWRVVDTAKAAFGVENYMEFLSIQADSALRDIVRLYPYDAPDDTGGISLRGSSREIAERLKDEICKKVEPAGLEVAEARITHLAYAPEIAAAMLQRQQAAAIVDARKMIVDGAVGMVTMALDKLREENVIDLDEERKAAMVSNLLVVLCGNKDAQPVVNSGSLY